MYISTKDWLRYINRLAAINKKARDEMVSWIQKHGFADTSALIDYAYGLATKYGEGAGALAAEMYDATAQMQKALVEPAVPAETASYNEVAKTARGTAKSGNPELVGGAVGRLVKRAAARTTIRNAERDGAEWAWVPHGDTCPFCIMLASNGWQGQSKKAKEGGHKEHIHANCDCEYAVRFDSQSGVRGYDPDKYLAMYEGAEGSSWQEKLNAMRREDYAKNADRINEQKRAAYKARNERLQGGDGNAIITKSKNLARAIDSMILTDDDNHRYTPGEILQEMQKSPVGIKTIRNIRDGNVVIEIVDMPQFHTNRGEQVGNIIKIYSANIKNQRVAGQTVIHEMTHFTYQIGQSQHAEAVCFAMEKMHLLGRDYLTGEEWEQMVAIAKQAYPEYDWEDGGYGDFTQFNFVVR